LASERVLQEAQGYYSMITFLMVSPKYRLGINPQAESSSLLKQTNP